MKKISFVLLLLLFVGITTGNSGGRKKFVVTMPLGAPDMGIKCDWDKESHVDIVCEIDAPASSARLDVLLMLRPTVWTEDEWKKVLAHPVHGCDEAKNPGSCKNLFQRHQSKDKTLAGTQH